MKSVWLLVGLTLSMWVLIFIGAHWALSRSRDYKRTSWILLGTGTIVGILLALRDSGDDPIPSYLVGQMIGSAIAFVLPVAVAVGIDYRRRTRDRPSI